MESEASSLMWLQSLETTFCSLFFSFTLCFSVISLLVFLVRTMKPWCDCEVCRSYLTASWRADFDNLCDWYTHLLQKSPTGTIHVHVLGNIITANPANVEHMLKTKFNNYPKGKPFSAILGDLLGGGIFNVDGDSWRFQRKMASLELGSLSVRSFAFQTVKSEIQCRLLPLLSSAAAASSDEHVGLDLQDVFRRFSFDNICRFSFGLDPGCLRPSQPTSELAEAFDLASRLSAERALAVSPLVWKLKRMLNLGSEKQLKKAIKVVNQQAEKIIKERRKMDFSAANKEDLLSRFMSAIADDDYIRDIVVSFLLAGRDTVASALTSFFWVLQQHPEVESAIRAESDKIMGPTQEVASIEQMREMHYLQAAIHESMRLYPPVQFDSKFSQEDDTLPDGTFVHSSTRVTYHPYAMGRVDRVWGSDCMEFKPQRWLRNGVFTPESPFKYPVFQGGLRVCLGKELALVEMRSVALSLIRRFDIRVETPSQSLRFAPGLTATVRGGLPVVVREIVNPIQHLQCTLT